MKKIIALTVLLSLLCCLLASCATPAPESTSDTTSNATSISTEPTTAPTTNTTEPTSEHLSEPEMRVAMITDYGDIDDMSYNQVTYEATKQWCEVNGTEYAYYTPTLNDNAARLECAELAIKEGHNVLVMPGYAFGGVIAELSPLYPDIKFIGLDVSKGDLLQEAVAMAGETYDWNPDNWNLNDFVEMRNVYCCTYREEIAGYLAGYAAVKMGYTKLGFLGSMIVPAVQRYGYGFIQGADAAAKETETAVSIKHAYDPYYFYGTFVDFYNDGTEIVMGCGCCILDIYDRDTQKIDKVIGVDTDIAPTIDDWYGTDLTVTSAMKDIGGSILRILDEIKTGNWEAYCGNIELLGLPYVCLPESTQWNECFTQQDYETLLQAIADGTLTISDDITNEPVTEYITVEYLGYLM